MGFGQIALRAGRSVMKVELATHSADAAHARLTADLGVPRDPALPRDLRVGLRDPSCSQ